MYGESGRLADACRVFDEMPERDVVSWSLMVSCFVLCGKAGRGLGLFAAMMSSETVEYDSVVVATVAEGCGSLGLLREAKSVHGHVLRTWAETNELVDKSFIAMYNDCCHIENAEKLFRMAARRSVVTAMISSYNQRSCFGQALLSFTEMLKSMIEPNFVTVMGVLSSCTQMGLLKEGKSVHYFSLRRGIDPHLNSLGSALISMYSSFRQIKSCFCVFNAIVKKTVKSWNSLIAASVQNGSPEKALELFAQMLSEGLLPDSSTLSSALPVCGHTCDFSLGSQIHGVAVKFGFLASSFVSNSLIDMYCKCGFTDTAFAVFDAIKHKNVITWNTLIGGLSESNSNSEKAIALFEQMHYQRVDTDSITYLNAIKACTNLGCLNKGRWIHQKLITFGLKNDSYISAALTNMYAKCGDVEMARAVFDRVSEKNVVMWRSIISGYGNHGLVNDAILLFTSMVESGVRPNEVTFMAMLSACSHVGLVEEGLCYFDMMEEEFGLEPQIDHCNSVVDLKSLAGQIDRAHKFIRSMQVEPNASIWRAQLNGCYIHHSEDMASVIQKRIL